MQEKPTPPKTMFEKIWDAHVVRDVPGETPILYIDRHLVHEMTSPQAFAGLRTAGIKVHRPDATITVLDHNVPTVPGRRMLDVVDKESALCLTTMEQNARDFDLTLFDMGDARQGIVHIIGPEQGLTLPGMTIVCGDSHTSTHGALGALAFGIGTSEVEQVLATQCLLQKRPKTMHIRVAGKLAPEATAKDLALAIIGKLGTGVATGYVIEFSGPAIRDLTMEGRMTLCNMAIEAGARAGMVAPDETTFAYIKGRPYAPKGERFEQAVAAWRQLASDPGASFDAVHEVNVDGLGPQVTWGTNPGMVADVKGKHVAPTVRAMVVPGSMQVRRMAEEEGIAAIFREAGFEWRESGCSMCIAMNGDQLAEGERCASTSNRNFEGRQGKGGRTHLVSPAMAAAAAIAGHFVDIREM